MRTAFDEVMEDLEYEYGTDWTEDDDTNDEVNYPSLFDAVDDEEEEEEDGENEEVQQAHGA